MRVRRRRCVRRFLQGFARVAAATGGGSRRAADVRRAVIKQPPPQAGSSTGMQALPHFTTVAWKLSREYMCSLAVCSDRPPGHETMEMLDEDVELADGESEVEE